MNHQEQSNREKALFEQALDLASEPDRLAYLQKACADDAALLARVLALLRTGTADEGFLPEQPAEKPAAGDGSTPTRLIPPAEQPGDRIGRYKLLEQIGEGGCGVVYMAEQAEPIRRRVALKVIKLGMDTKSVVARFEAERQALALMDHPNIAKVFDAGSTSAGRPYFVMELVRGVAITTYCNEHQCSMRERLDLFIQVCHAVQHAHQKGIIHRDLKPSNILVTLHDGVPVPKVIDFGIAKATSQQPLTDKTLFTAFQQFIGTPAYMSPEQAEMSGLDIDTRSDLYSLGVLLYELLTGRPPFAPEALLRAGFDEMRRLIREQEPTKPSICLSTLAASDLTTAARQRHVEPPKLVSQVRGDLDWIVMKCLEKERARRYETASALAQDLTRHLNHEPVSAAAPGALYRMRKFARRHRAGLAAATTVALLLVGGVVASTWQAVRATRAEQRAQSEAAKYQMVATFMMEMWEGLKPLLALNANTQPLIAVLEKSVGQLQAKVRGQPDAEAELLEILGGTYAELGQTEQANRLLGQALAMRKQQYGAESLDFAATLYNGALVLSRHSRWAEAERSLREAQAIVHKHPAQTNVSELTLLDTLAEALAAQNKWPEAIQVSTENVAAHPTQAWAYYRRANLFARHGQWLAASDDFGKAAELVPTEHAYCMLRATVLLAAGDRESFHRHCQRMLERFGADTNAVIAQRVAQSCLLVPASGTTLEIAGQAADRALALRTNAPSAAYYQFAKGLADYRRGQYSSAVAWIGKMINQPITTQSTERLYPRDVCGYMVQAMAWHQLNQPAEARQALAQGLELARAQLPPPGTNNLGGNWYDPLLAHLLMREAQELIEKK